MAERIYGEQTNLSPHGHKARSIGAFASGEKVLCTQIHIVCALLPSLLFIIIIQNERDRENVPRAQRERHKKSPWQRIERTQTVEHAQLHKCTLLRRKVQAFLNSRRFSEISQYNQHSTPVERRKQPSTTK